MEQVPICDAQREAKAVVRAAAERNAQVRITGGIAVSILCPSSPRGADHKDIDLVGRSADRAVVEAVLTGRGYVPSERFNALRGSRRLLYTDESHRRDVDVFFDSLEMCHDLDVGDRLLVAENTLPPADLLLSKLQIVQPSERDFQDICSLLCDCEIDETYVAQLLSRDWGWWRTVTASLKRVVVYANQHMTSPQGAYVTAGARSLSERIDATPKTRRWKLRGRVGERMRWYREPEEIEGV